jgi:hypothetical protein
MRNLLRRVWYAIRQTRLEADLADEMDFHREMKLTELQARGLASPERSRRAFGSGALARNQSRDVWIWPWLQDLVQAISRANIANRSRRPRCDQRAPDRGGDDGECLAGTARRACRSHRGVAPRLTGEERNLVPRTGVQHVRCPDARSRSSLPSLAWC